MIAFPVDHARQFLRLVRLRETPDDRRLLSASSDQTARVWDVSSAVKLGEVKHLDEVLAVRFDAAGKPTQSYGAVNSSGPGRVLSFGMKLLF